MKKCVIPQTPVQKSLNRSTHSHPDVVPPWRTLKPHYALHPSQDLLFESTGNDTLDYIPLSAWKVALNDEMKPWCREARAAGNDDPSVTHESLYIESCCTNEEDMIAREVKFAVKALVSTELSNIVEKALADVLRMSLPIGKSASNQLYIAGLSRYCWKSYKTM